MIAVDLTHISCECLMGNFPSNGIDVFVCELLHGFVKADCANDVVLFVSPQQLPYAQNIFRAHKLLVLPFVREYFTGAK